MGESQKQPSQAADPAAGGAVQAAAAGTAAESGQEQTPAQKHQAAGGKDSEREPRRKTQRKGATKKRKGPARKGFAEKVRGIRDEVCVNLCCCPGGARQAEMALPGWGVEKGVCRVVL